MAKVPAYLAFTIEGLPVASAVKKVYVATNNLYILQNVDDKSYISRAPIEPFAEKAQTVTVADHMIIGDTGNTQSLDYFPHNGKSYFLMGIKPNALNWSTQVGRIEYEAGKEITNNTEITRIAAIHKAQSNGESIGDLLRSESAVSSSHKEILILAMNDDGTGNNTLSVFTRYDLEALNKVLDEIEASGTNYISAADTRVKATAISTKKVSGNLYNLTKNHSIQGMDLSDGGSVYLSSGDQGETPYVSKFAWNGYINSGFPLYNIYWPDVSLIETGGLQLKDRLYLSLSYHSENGNGIDSNVVYWIDKAKIDTNGDQDADRVQGGQDTGTPTLSGKKPLSSVEGYEYPASGWVQLSSGAQERKTPDFDNGEKGTKHYAGSTKIKYTAKVNGSGRMWVKVAATGWYLPIGKLSTLDNITKLTGSGRYEKVGYVTDQNTSQPWEFVLPYSATLGGIKANLKPLGPNTLEWEKNFSIVNDTPSTSFTPTSDEIAEMERVKSEIEANASGDDVIITYITDTHVDAYQSPSDAAALRSIELASYYSKTYGSDLLVHGGDMEDGNSSRALSLIDMERSVDAIKTSQRPYIILQGNHDDNSGYVRDEAGYQTNQLITNATANSYRLANYLVRPTGTKNPNNAIYGTYDIPNSRVTIMVLDGFDQPDVDTVNTGSTDGKVHFASFRHGYTKYSQAQHDWAAATMKSLASQGRQVLVMNHISLRGVPGKLWVDNTQEKIDGKFEYHADLSHLGQAMYDDVIKPYSSNIIGYVAGHTHEDDYALSDGVQFVTTTCAQAGRGVGGSKRLRPDNFAFDVLQISPRNKTVKRHRYGFGRNNESGYFLGSWKW
ncbi:helveticin J family class III bacteriocin [Lentilactobacillus senioris]|uniref:helveticin J family class III bacteriocin n=1 Tax=Lentilactobacillus senioris TaxID=931534 RepID=UPI003D2BB1D5